MTQRYIATIEVFLWAESDEQALEQAQEVCKEETAHLVSIVEQPFGRLGCRPVNINQ